MLSIGKLSHLAQMYEDKELEDGPLDGKVFLYSQLFPKCVRH